MNQKRDDRDLNASNEIWERIEKEAQRKDDKNELVTESLEQFRKLYEENLQKRTKG